MLSNVDTQLATQAAQASQYVTPSTGAVPSPSGPTRPPEYVVQLIDQTGQVRATSSEAEHGPILNATQLAEARNGRIRVTVDQEGEQLRLLAEPFVSRPGWVVVAGASLETYHATMHRVQLELVIGGIVFVVAAALGAFGLATAALRPVERLRREVSDIARHQASGTLAVPATRDEIAALAQTMNDLLRSIQSALARERNLIADASHELRTPFAVLQGELELAARPGRSQEELQDTLGRVSEEVSRLWRLADDLLLLSRSDQGHLTVHRHHTHIKEILDESAAHGGERARALDVTIGADVLDGLSWDVDQRRIRQAIDNLVDNALRFATPGSEIRLEARTEGNDLVLSVSDDGPVSPSTTSRTPSNGSGVPTPAAAAAKAEPDSEWRSSKPSPSPTRARPPRPIDRVAAPS